MRSIMRQTLLSLVALLFLVPNVWAQFDINSASKEELKANMVNVGDKKAQAIVNYRKKHGKFKSLDDLANVPGIGEKTLEKNRKILGNLKGKSVKSKVSKKDAAKKDSTKEKAANKSKKKKSEQTKSSLAKSLNN